MSTIFKKIIDKEIPADIVYEDDICLAFKDIDPKAPVHVLIIPKKEIPSMAEVTEGDKEILGHMMVKASEVAKSLGISDSGYRLVANTNPEGGQEVYHLHIHLLGGRQMTWPPG
ncbi:MAG: histidine triad nucleotide-binding protein [Thermodesulfobacteriota bacterium]